MIALNQIPINLRVPGHFIEINNTNLQRGLTGYPTKVLVVGQKLAGAPGAVLTPILITNKDQGKVLFGAGSQLAQMLERFKGVNSFVEVWAIAQVDAGASTAAVGEISFTGTATAAGTLPIYIGGRKTTVAIAQADTNTAIATKVVAAINANTDLAVTAEVDSGDAFQVNLTAKNKGVVANGIDTRIGYYQDDTTPPGVTSVVIQLAGGAGNPDITAVLAAIGDDWYTDIAMPYTDSTNIVALEAALTEKAAPLKMIEAKCYITRSGTLSDLVTAGGTRNHPYIFPMGVQKSPSPSYEWSAAIAAACAYSLQIDPARPVQTLELPGLMPPAKKDLFTIDERNILLFNGHSTFVVDAGGVVRLERVISSYRKSAMGADDDSYLNIETIATLAFLRYDTRTYMANRFPRHKLADDGTRFSQGDNVATPKVIRDALIARGKLWEEHGLLENFEAFKAGLLVERNSGNRDRADALIPVDAVNQFRTGAYQIDQRG